MKIWFEGDIIYYDLEYMGIRPQFIQQPGHTIIEATLNGSDAYVKSEKGDYIIKDIDEPSKTRVVFVNPLH